MPGCQLGSATFVGIRVAKVTRLAQAEAYATGCRGNVELCHPNMHGQRLGVRVRVCLRALDSAESEKGEVMGLPLYHEEN